MCLVIRSKMLSLWSLSHDVTFPHSDDQSFDDGRCALSQWLVSDATLLTGMVHGLAMVFRLRSSEPLPSHSFIVSLALACSLICVRNVSFHSDGSTRMFGFSFGAKGCHCWACLYLGVAIFFLGLSRGVQNKRILHTCGHTTCTAQFNF